MKLCNYCQRELDDRQQICPYCGEQQEPTPIRYQRNEYTEESYSEPKRVRTGQALGGVGMSLLSYFGYIRSKWSGRNVVATSGALSWLTVLLYSLFTGLLVLVPGVITVWVLNWIISTLDQTLYLLPPTAV